MRKAGHGADDTARIHSSCCSGSGEGEAHNANHNPIKEPYRGLWDQMRYSGSDNRSGGHTHVSLTSLIADLRYMYTNQRRGRDEHWHEAGGVSLSAALEENLGLKLESRKASIEILVIDHVDKMPVGN